MFLGVFSFASFSSTFLLLYYPPYVIHTFDDIWSRKLLVRRIRQPPVMSFLLHAYLLVAVPIYIYIYLFPIASFRLVLYRDFDIFLYSVLSIPSSIDNYYIFLGNNDRSSLFLYFSFLLLLLSFSFLYLFFLFLFYFILFF